MKKKVIAVVSSRLDTIQCPKTRTIHREPWHCTLAVFTKLDNKKERKKERKWKMSVSFQIIGFYVCVHWISTIVNTAQISSDKNMFPISFDTVSHSVTVF